MDPDFWDNDLYEEWLNDRVEPNRILKIAIEVFEKDGRLRIFTPSEWKDDWVISSELRDPDDDLPF